MDIANFILNAVDSINNFCQNIVQFFTNLFDFTVQCREVFTVFSNTVSSLFSSPLLSSVFGVLTALFFVLCSLKMANR